MDKMLAYSQTCIAHRMPMSVDDLVSNNRQLRGFFAPVLISKESSDAVGVVALLEDITDAKALEKSKEEFFSIASHELRTPLTAIRGNSSMIQEFFAKDITDPEAKETLSDIHESSVRLIGIVNDFLDASRLEQGKVELKLEKFDINDVIAKVAYELKALGKEHDVYIKFEPATTHLSDVYADKNRIQQIIYNIVGNALKFIEKGGVTVSEVASGEFIKVLVSDTGKGISLEGQSLLFHKFQQVGDGVMTKDVAKGTGLGLYISKLLIEKMGGSIKLEHSELGVGTVFSFTVPVAT
jgi:signal transduction histidine kinase